MNTNESGGAAVKAAEFTPAEVSAWLRAEMAKLDLTDIKEVSLQINSNESLTVTAMGYEPNTWNIHSESGHSLAEAVAKLRERIPTGPALIQAKLDQIEKLRAEIAALDGKLEGAA